MLHPRTRAPPSVRGVSGTSQGDRPMQVRAQPGHRRDTEGRAMNSVQAGPILPNPNGHDFKAGCRHPAGYAVCSRCGCSENERHHQPQQPHSTKAEQVGEPS